MQKRAFTVPGKPQAKARPRVGKHGAYTPKKTAEYETLVKLSYKSAYPEEKPFRGEIRADITAFFQIPKSMPKFKKRKIEYGELHPTSRPDADNIAKSILDALNGIAYPDDAAIVMLTVRKRYSDEPRAEVMLYGEEENDDMPENR